jgi:hypothetical protein
MPALDALRQALDVQQATASGVVSPARPLPTPAPAHRPADRVTLSAAARSLASGAAPSEGEPTDLEGALRSRSLTGSADAARPGAYGAPSGPALEPIHVDLFA